jgi:hypothetical protein
MHRVACRCSLSPTSLHRKPVQAWETACAAAEYRLRFGVCLPINPVARSPQLKFPFFSAENVGRIRERPRRAQSTRGLVSWLTVRMEVMREGA